MVDQNCCQHRFTQNLSLRQKPYPNSTSIREVKLKECPNSPTGWGPPSTDSRPKPSSINVQLSTYHGLLSRGQTPRPLRFSRPLPRSLPHLTFLPLPLSLPAPYSTSRMVFPTILRVRRHYLCLSLSLAFGLRRLWRLALSRLRTICLIR